MPGQVRFTSPDAQLFFDGTTDGKVVKFDLAVPRETHNTTQRATVDGSEIVVASYVDVQETIWLYLENTVANLKVKVRQLEKMLQEAKRAQYNLHIEGPVYLDYRIDSGSEWNRSEITSGIVLPEPGLLDLYMKQGKIMIEVQLTRKFYWEEVTETELSLSNPAGSGTGGRTIYNANDGNAAVRYNYVEVDNSIIAGDLPSPVRIQMYNSYNDADRMGDVYVGMQHSGIPGSLPHTIEGEAKTGGSGTILPVTPDYTLYSGGQYFNMTWSDTAETLIGKWALSAANLDALGGNYFHVFGIATTTITYADLRLRLKLFVSLDELWSSDQFYPANGTKLIDFGSVRLPPYKSIGTPYELNFQLYAQRGTSGSHALPLDFLLLLPLNHWRLVDTYAFNTDYQVTLYVDEPNGAAYTKGWPAAPSAELHNYTLRGTPLELVPLPATTGKQRIVFLMREWTEAAFFDPKRTASIRAYYRPRKLTI